MPVNAIPWENLIYEDRDGVWAGIAAWEKWLSFQMPPEAADGFMDADNKGCWKENLYVAVSKAIKEAKPCQ